MKRRGKSKKSPLIVIGIVFLVITLIVMYMSGTLKTAQQLLILSGMLKESEKLVDSGPGINRQPVLENDPFTAYQSMAADLDMSKINEMLKDSKYKIDIPEQYWDMRYWNNQTNSFDQKDIVGEIELYMLICEILSRPEINPKDSRYKIKPEYVYGSWLLECSSSKRGTLVPFDPYTQPVMNRKSGGGDLYYGPFSLHKSVMSQTGDASTVRMYVYVPVQEAKDLNTNNRVMRVLHNELYGSVPNFSTIIGQSYEPLQNKVEYAKTLKSAIKYDYERPHPEVASDAIYTFCRKLRTASLGRDLYTLNPSEVNGKSINNLNALFQQHFSGASDSVYSDLNYFFGVSLNSGRVNMHQWNSSITPNEDNVGAMPYLYSKMYQKYGTLNICETTIFSGWSEQSHIDAAISGKEKGKTHLSKTPITYQKNLVSEVGARDVFDKAILEQPSTEYSWTSTYPLEALGNGYMVARAVETVIEQTYNWQRDKGYLLSQAGIAGEDTSKDDLVQGEKLDLSSFGIKGSTDAVLPYRFSSKFNMIMSHGYLCQAYGGAANAFCPYHRNFTHRGADLTFTNGQGQKIQVDIVSMFDGEIVAVDDQHPNDPKNYPFGYYVIVKSNFNGNELWVRYAHLASVNFTSSRVGTQIKRGERIGLEGTTGNSTGNHLHLGVSRERYAKFLDPTKVINYMEAERCKLQDGK